MSDSSVPELSVVIVAPAGMTTIGETMGCLRAQTVADRIEVVIVTPSPEQIDAAALGATRFAALRTIGAGPITTRGNAAAAGIQAATAPVISLVEDHSYPEPEWASALIAAHRHPWAGVGPRVENANPGSAVSRVNFWLGYAAMTGAQEAGPRPVLAWHNTAYKREVLLGYGDALGELLDWEGNLQADLLARGHLLFLEPAACTRHLNVSRLRAAFDVQFHHGRILAGQHADRERWSRLRRATYAAAMPLFPAMHLMEVIPVLGHLGVTRKAILADAPVLVAMLAVMALGEAAGYLTGPGAAIGGLTKYELYRSAYLSRRDHARRQSGVSPSSYQTDQRKTRPRGTTQL